MRFRNGTRCAEERILRQEVDQVWANVARGRKLLGTVMSVAFSRTRVLPPIIIICPGSGLRRPLSPLPPQKSCSARFSAPLWICSASAPRGGTATPRLVLHVSLFDNHGGETSQRGALPPSDTLRWLPQERMCACSRSQRLWRHEWTAHCQWQRWRREQDLPLTVAAARGARCDEKHHNPAEAAHRYRQASCAPHHHC